MPQRGNLRRRAHRALDAANFTLADVRDGLGPYLAIYLLTEQHWVDAVRAKRWLMALAAIVVTAASLVLPLFPGF